MQRERAAGRIRSQAAFGGFNRIDFKDNGYKVSPIIISPGRKQRLNDNLLLFFTGFSRFSSEIQKSTEAAIKDKTAQLKEMARRL